MKNYRIAILFGVLLFTLNNMHGQISEGGLPPSFHYGHSLRSTIPQVQIPVTFNVEDLKLVDEWQVSQGQPLKVATLIESNLTMDNAGTWSVLPGGESVWQLNIQAKGAIALMLYYKAFYIPEGGKLFIYNAEKTQVIGAFTHHSNPTVDRFATEFVAGDDIVLEYVAASDGEKPRIEIESIGYGYNHLTVGNNPSLRSSSSSCYISINCEEGNNWQTEKTGVCKMIQRIGDKSYLCSGSLVNNTAENFKPYILSAYHCSADLETTASASDYNQWVFYFHYESDCGDNLPAVSSQTMVGCKKVVEIPISGGSDGLLLLLNRNIPDNYYAYYNGWDRRERAATSGVGIHHPEGDYKKISTFTGRATSISWLDENDNEGAENAHWNVIFAETANGVSVTAGGSSGSPLFNQNKLIVGTLSGGNSSCDEPKGLNLYGKLSYHWDKYSKKPTERMDIWLDPASTNAETLRGRYKKEPVVVEKPSNLQLTYTNNQVLLSWQAPATQVPARYNVYKNSELLRNTTALSYTDNPSKTGSIIYSVSAVYPNGVESEVVSKTLFVTEYLAPSNPQAIFDPSSGVIVTWSAPLYQQTIYWGTGSPANIAIGFSGIPFYFGQGWKQDEITPFRNKLLKSIQFVPVKNVTYSLLITQGNREYTQPLTNLVYNKLNVVDLQTPFTIDNKGSLIVAIYASDYDKATHPAWCDNGPAEMRKGNLISEDGINWEYIENEDFDFNFFLAAVVTSEEGTGLERNQPVTNLAIKKSNKKMSVQTVPATDLQLRSSMPATFPEVTGYNVYRDNRRVNTSPVTGTRYVDAIDGSGAYKYAVSASYNGWESTQAVIQRDVVVSAEQRIENQLMLTPTLFNNYITLLNAAEVKKLEIISIDGKLVKIVDNPGDIVYTESLPKGIYVFRLTTDKEVKIIRGVKQ
ncbi:MAG: T9SS type A sorting domain-containing protein [Tannerellaceae bacterium]|nr:T9SS type A sorting domain-containing protein [Tannerellaceae bacterium]